MSTGEVDAYYRRLDAWNRVAAAVGYGGGRAALTVHRALADPRAGGRPTFTRLHDVLVDHLPRMRAPAVLDAGCGLGGTMLHLARTLNATCLGLTLSAAQCERANAEAGRRGIGDRVKAVVRRYDDPPGGPYDAIVAIESLAHSADPARTIEVLARLLAPGGVLAIVDDMPEPEADADTDLAQFKEGWRLPVLWSARHYRTEFARRGLDVSTDVDLTAECRTRSLAHVRSLMALNRLVSACVPSPALRDVMRSHRGGLALERLIRRGLLRYRLLIASRPTLQVS
jgi:SAM-dependent methyltransferase